jgi:TusA-related sulfurtransferase
VIRVSDAVRRLAAGDKMIIVTDKPSVVRDMPAWSRLTNNDIESVQQQGDLFYIHVTRSPRCTLQPRPPRS